MVQVDQERVKLVAEFLKDEECGEPLNFYSYKTKDGGIIIASDEYPSIKDDLRQVINFFSGVVMQDFGFWLGNERGYQEPIYGTINGKRLKGANFLWVRSMQLHKDNTEFFDPSNLMVLPINDAKRWFSDDTGKVLFQDFETRLRIIHAYGKRRLKSWINYQPEEVVHDCNFTPRPLSSFLGYLKTVPGYKEDSLQKKAILLAMVLANRPEHFLKVAPDDPDWRPIVDYHLMRLSLRLGLVKAEEYQELLTSRQWVERKVEGKIRRATFRAVLNLIRQSGKTMAEIDKLLWFGRKYCPEMTPPECEKCLFYPVCEKKIEFFQPVYRTTYY